MGLTDKRFASNTKKTVITALGSQLEHADKYLLFPKNFSSDMSLDETCLSNGEVYTILTNKASHGGRGIPLTRFNLSAICLHSQHKNQESC